MFSIQPHVELNEVIPINSRLYCIKNARLINQYLIIGDSYALLLDTGFGFHDYRNLISKLTNLPIIVVNTHADLDHCGGNYLFNKVHISIYDYKNLKFSSSKENKILHYEYRVKKNPDFKSIIDKDAYLLANIYDANYCFIDDGTVFDLGNRVLRVISTPGHTSGSICLYDETNGYLFTGDTIMKYSLYYTMDYCEPLIVYYHSLKKLEKNIKRTDIIFPGHGDIGLNCNLLEEFIKTVEEIHSSYYKDNSIITPLGDSGYVHKNNDFVIYYSKIHLDNFLRTKLLF